MTIANRLRELLDSNGMSQVELADACNENEMRISRYVRGETEPKASVLSKIADAFGVTADYILGRELPTRKKSA